MQAANMMQTKKEYLRTIFPFIIALFIQRAEHLVDNRFMAILGGDALRIHSIFYIFFAVGQAVGVASSASLLTLWNRKESQHSQLSLTRKHFVLTFGISSIAIGFGFYLLPQILSHFDIQGELLPTARFYLKLGLINLGLQALLGLTLTLMIASNQRKMSLLLMGTLLLVKGLAAYIAVHVFWDHSIDATSLYTPVAIIGLTSLISVSLLIFVSYLIVRNRITKVSVISFGKIFEVWNAELGVAGIRATAPAIFVFQIGTMGGQKSYYVLYQLALQAAYFVVLPILGANQIALRDGSAEQSRLGMSKIMPLRLIHWFKNYLWCALVPTEVLLLLCALFPSALFAFLYGIDISTEQARFLNLYFFAVMIGQVGNLMQVRLRSVKLNRIVTVNALVAEIAIQLGLMQLVVFLNWNSALAPGVVTLAYCLTHLGINALSVHKNMERSV
jgi:hypothetical protein